MERWTRRKFLSGAAQAAAGAAAAGASCVGGPASLVRDGAVDEGRQLEVPLDGPWLFRTDPGKRGEAETWFAPEASTSDWEGVEVPSTWQVSPRTAGYMGVAWYRREFEAPEDWRDKVVRIEFEAVFHTADIFINGKRAGGHAGKGYTAFALDISRLLERGRRNTVAVRVDNGFSSTMLPRNDSYDWTPDGGITRPVRLIVTPPVYIEAVRVDAAPDLAKGTASLDIRAVVRNATGAPVRLDGSARVLDETNGLAVLDSPDVVAFEIPAMTAREVTLPEIVLPHPRLWHFDHPDLYALEVVLSRKGEVAHRLSTTFGVRKIEVRGTEFLLNGEPVRLVGVERMAGSHPDFGMAEPASWIVHDHDDLKELNCVFTRVHWQQDRRVLDYCDRHGILIQVEVPTWGPGTFGRLEAGELEAITASGLAQLGETIGRERNHPCVFSWGLCNEVDGQNPIAQEFVRRMLGEAKRLDPSRLCSYASNSLQATPERDVAGEMDFIEWNEYYETWYRGGPEAMRQNLEAIHRAFPAKPVVISEYGSCACTADRPEDDARRARILETHNAVFRDYPWVGGSIFFDYNDYRTHIGDKGSGVLKQRVHGVVDVFGARKPSFAVLRRESSPVESFAVRREGRSLIAVARTRTDLPSYTLSGYTLRWTVYGNGGIPLERGGTLLPDLAPGAVSETRLEPTTRDALKILVEVFRPTGFAAAAATVTIEDGRPSRS
ncbi:MAG: glycoside hydrolase family 2 TIM barrel-domain containing protein [Candidatus Aminicenantes bacterium RBG_16_66_30]